MASIVLRCSSSSQATYRLRRAFSFHCKAHRTLILLLLASKPDPLSLGSGLGPPLRGGFVLLRENADFDRPFHRGAKSALRPRLFMPMAKKTSSARSLAPPFQIEPAVLGFDLVLGRNLEALASILLRCSKNPECECVRDFYFFLLHYSFFLISTLFSGFLEGRSKRESGIGKERSANALQIAGLEALRWASIWYWV